MDLKSKGDVPFSDILIDLGDSYNYTTGGYKYKESPPGEAVPSSSFNAAEAISAVFGFFDPSDPDLLSKPPDPEAPTLAPSNIFSSVSSAGFGETPMPSFGDSQPSSTSTVSTSNTGFGQAVPAFGCGGDEGPRPFEGAVPRSSPKPPFVTPLLRTGGFEALTPAFGGGNAPFGGPTQFGERNTPVAGGAPVFGVKTPPGGGFGPRARGGFRNHRGNSDRRYYNHNPPTGMRWNGGRFDGSDDSKSAPPTPTDGRFQGVNGFGRASEDGSLLPNRSRTGKREKESGSRHRNRKRSGRGRGRPPASETSDAKQATQEESKESNTQPFDFGIKRGVKSLGENAQHLGMETPHKRPRISCGNCGRSGHSTDACYSARNRESLRCYNCNNLGHLAVRCPQSSHAGRGAAGRGRVNGGRPRAFGGHPIVAEKAGGTAAAEENNLADANNNGNSGSGLSLICKLMQDAQMRRETQRRTPKLYDEMLTFMLEHVKL